MNSINNSIKIPIATGLIAPVIKAGIALKIVQMKESAPAISRIRMTLLYSMTVFYCNIIITRTINA